MRVLYINLDRGFGTVQIGKLFLDILKYINPISEIDIYNSQCCNLASKFTDTKYDLVIINEYSQSCVDYFLDKFSCPIINIAHSVTPSYIYNIALNNITDLHNNIFAIDFVPGNIWKNHNLPRNGTVMICRVCEAKINPTLLPFKVDTYGPIIEESQLKFINYKGNVSPKELVSIYNRYKFLLVLSTTECLCLPIREALLCGCTPIVYDPTRLYTQTIKDYILYYKEPRTKLYPFPFNFTNTVLQFLFGLRAYTNFNLKLDKTNSVKIKKLHQEHNLEQRYIYNILDEELLWKNLEKIG